MTNIPIDELKKIPYLDISSIDSRAINLMPLWDGQEWHLWIPNPRGLLHMKPIDAGEIYYVAKQPASQHDLYIPFIELVWQRMSYPTILPLIDAIFNDFHNMGTSIAKLKYFHDSSKTITNNNLSRFASTEIEYIIILARTIFDLLQEVISNIWQKHIKFNDIELEKRRNKQQLPDTFSRIILIDKEQIRTSEEINEKFGIPIKLANEYAKCADFFCKLRNIRDGIIHSGQDMDRIFITEKGFCVDPNKKPFSSFVDWDTSHYYNESLASILPWIADIVYQTISSCNSIMITLASIIEFPKEIAPSYKIFIRNPSTIGLVEVLRIKEGGTPWWE